MISGIIGLPGAGKSLLLSYLAHRAIKGKSLNFKNFNVQDFKYARVYTNFPFKGAYKLDLELLGKADFNNCLMLVDELQLLADCRNYKDFTDEFKEFFSLHRHDKLDFIYCTQMYDGIDKKIRCLTDRMYKIDKWLFNTIRVREVLAYSDVIRGRWQEGYEYASGFNTRYFFAPLLYKYNDTYSKQFHRDRIEVPLVPWVDSDSSPLGDTICNGEVLTINSDGSITKEV